MSQSTLSDLRYGLYEAQERYAVAEQACRQQGECKRCEGLWGDVIDAEDAFNEASRETVRRVRVS